MDFLSGVASFWQTYAVDPLSAALTFIHDAVGSYAIAIVLFTIAIRVLLIPLTVQQIRSQRRMQLLQPEITKLKKKYKGDRQAESAELMKLYRARGANPVSGCLPLFVQLPVLLALYGGILTLSGRGVLNEQFLWFNLAREDATFRIGGDGAPTVPTDLRFVTTTQGAAALESGLAGDFAGHYANYRVHVDAVPPDALMRDLAQGRLDLAFTGAPLPADQIPAGAVTNRLIQSVALSVQREQTLTRLSVAELRQILNGDRRTWADLGGDAGSITVHRLRSDLGTLPLLTQVVLNGRPIAVQAEIKVHDTVDALISAIKGDRNALGLSMPLPAEGLRALNVVAEGTTRGYQPLFTSLRDGLYPLVRDQYAYGPVTSATPAAFFQRWWLSESGQSAAQRAGFTRIPPNTGLFGTDGFYLSLLASLAGFFQWIQARMMVQKGVEGQAATMNRVMQFMPILVILFAWTFQSGLVLYWVLSSIIGIVQQYFTTGTGALIPATWPLARDALAEHRAKVAEASAVAADDGNAGTPAGPVARRRRARRRGG
ncbi:MAG: membrane protein insertase YidC [Actinobacteria bacterium]|nr:membrane protein insertase YidC [Actinomycetota bacterium]